MHHPPLLTGMPAFDEIGLPELDRLALGDLVAANPHVVRVVTGHVHRAIFGTAGGCGVVVCPSTYLQAPLEIGTHELNLVEEPPPSPSTPPSTGAWRPTSNPSPIRHRRA